MARTKSVVSGIVAEIVKAVNGRRFAETAEFYQEAERAGIFDGEAFEEFAIIWAKKELIRRALRRKGEDGYPLFPNITLTDPKTGKKRRLYMREKYMKPPQYLQVADYWSEYSEYGAKMSNETLKRCNHRYHTQYELRYSESDSGDDGVEPV